MQATERIDTIAQQCRTRYYPYPESLITAICQYVSGNGSLTTIQQEWQAASNNVQYHTDRFIAISDPKTERLDEMDLRILDICIVTGSISDFFSRIAADGPVEQARDYLRAQGIDEPRIIESLINQSQSHSYAGSPTALGRLILAYIPEHFSEIFKISYSLYRRSSRSTLFDLLLSTQPGEEYRELAWQLAQTTTDLDELDRCAADLLKADPARFTDWARKVARDTIQHNQLYNYRALEALLELDLAQHIDLAVEAAQTPPPQQSWYRAKLQCIGVAAAYRFDPAQYL